MEGKILQEKKRMSVSFQKLYTTHCFCGQYLKNLKNF